MSDFAWLRKIVEARTPRPWSLSPNKQFVRSVRPVFEETERLAEFVHDYDANFIATAGTIADAWLTVVIAAADVIRQEGTCGAPINLDELREAVGILSKMVPK